MHRNGSGRALAPGLALLAIVLAAGLAGYITAGGGSTSQSSQPSQAPDSVRGTVRSLNGDTLTLDADSGSVEVKLPVAARIEALRPAILSQVTQGDWLNAGATPNERTVFTLSGLVIIPASQLRPR